MEYREDLILFNMLLF